MRARPDDIAGKGQPSFVGRRQQHQNATFTTAMHFTPRSDGDRAGLVAFQSENFFYALTVTLADGKPVVQVERRSGATDTADRHRLEAARRARGSTGVPARSTPTVGATTSPSPRSATGGRRCSRTRTARCSARRAPAARAPTSPAWSSACTRTPRREVRRDCAILALACGALLGAAPRARAVRTAHVDRRQRQRHLLQSALLRRILRPRPDPRRRRLLSHGHDHARDAGAARAAFARPRELGAA